MSTKADTIISQLSELADELRNQNIVAYTALKRRVLNVFPEVVERDPWDLSNPLFSPSPAWGTTVGYINNPQDTDE